MLWLGKQGTRCDSGTAPPLYVNDERIAFYRHCLAAAVTRRTK